jgi:hypothetical protein
MIEDAWAQLVNNPLRFWTILLVYLTLLGFYLLILGMALAGCCVAKRKKGYNAANAPWNRPG